MPDVTIKVMSLNPKREYSIDIKGLAQDQLPDYVSKTYRDLIDLLGAEQIDIKVDNKELLTEDETPQPKKPKYPDTDLHEFYQP